MEHLCHYASPLIWFKGESHCHMTHLSMFLLPVLSSGRAGANSWQLWCGFRGHAPFPAGPAHSFWHPHPITSPGHVSRRLWTPTFLLKLTGLLLQYQSFVRLQLTLVYSWFRKHFMNLKSLQKDFYGSAVVSDKVCGVIVSTGRFLHGYGCFRLNLVGLLSV